MKVEENEEIERIKSMIDDMQMVHLATFDGSFPRVRPMTMVRFGSEYFVLTSTNDAKIEQLSENPLVEICIALKSEKGNGYIRIDGKMDIINDKKIRADVAMNTSYFSEYWSTPEDPTYALVRFTMNNIEFMEPGDMYAKKFKLVGSLVSMGRPL